MTVTASQLYDHAACPRRVDLDAHGDPARRGEVSAFVRMLWQAGAHHEAEIVKSLPGDTVRLAGLAGADRAALTLKAMNAGAPVIHGGRIAADDLLGDPDLLLRQGDRYVPADVKSGRADEDGGDEAGSGRLKLQYALQVALYVDVLERLGLSAGRTPEIWDVRGDKVPYHLDERRGVKSQETWWSRYEADRNAVRAILAAPHSTRGAFSSICGLCHWREHCADELGASDDLTQIPFLGRTLRDGMAASIRTVRDFAAADPEAFVVGRKTVFAGIGPDRLRTFHARARLLSEDGAVAYLKSPINLPSAAVEIFFDIEADPMRDVVYLHGFVERRDREPGTETFSAFFADDPSPAGERQAFADAIAYLDARPDAAVFHYSKYERTAYRKLQRRFPEVCTAEVVEALFTPPRATDLYCDVVLKATEWPTRSHSIKSLAKHLGFRWRDADPSGAASIEWYHRWIETGDPAVRRRIVDYNEDDCLATRVLLDGIRTLPVQGADPARASGPLPTIDLF